MNSLMRMAYGRSGSRMERVLVSSQHQEPVADPLWLKLLLLAVWIVIPIVVSLYAIPKAAQQQTVIDLSRLQAKPLPIPESPILPKPRPVPPPARRVVPKVKPEAQPKPVVARPLEKPPVAPRIAPKPVITRPNLTRSPEAPAHQPRIARERARADVDPGVPVMTRISRETSAGVEPVERATITRTRGATAADAPVGRERVAPLRRAASSEGGTAGPVVSLRPEAHRGRSLTASGSMYGSPSGTTDGRGTRVAMVRERSSTSGAGGAGENGPAAAAGVVRTGVSFNSLQICPNPGEEEDAIRKVLRVVESRQSCTNSLGEFQFIGTQRISSFNLMIFPANGRRPSNRCEELDNAYKCLKTR